MKKFVGASIALALGLSGAIGGAALSASAHDHTDGVDCSAATVALQSYDAAATVKITLDGAVVVPTMPFGGSYQYNQPLTFDKDHQSHTMIVEVLSGDAGYSFTHTDVSPASCYTPPPVGRDVPILPVTYTPATCTSGVTYTVPVQDADVKYALLPDGSRPVPGTFPLKSGTIQISAHVIAADLLENGGKDNPNDYTSDVITGSGPIHNASCVAVQTCHALGTAYHESDDNAGVLEPSGWYLFNNGNGKPTDVIFPATGNLQGITHFTRNVSGTAGNGIFTRFIVDLSADGGSAYNSLSITDVTATQASIADVGSKNVFLGKTIAQIADLYPDAVYHAISFQTGSSYPNGDGAVLTGFSDGGNCVESFVTTPPAPTHRVVVTHTDVVCTPGGVGGGSFTTTTTDYTTNPVWNQSTGKFDLVETVDADYPQTTTTATDASLESCPIHATPVPATVPVVPCGVNPTGVLPADTATVSYAFINSSLTGVTLVATPAANVVLDATDGFIIQDDGTAQATIAYPAVVKCDIISQLTNTLALTGSNPVTPFWIAVYLLVVGIITLLAVTVIKRHNRLHNEA